MKKSVKSSLAILLCVALWMSFLLAEKTYWWIHSFLHPYYYMELQKKFESESTEYLIKQLYSYNFHTANQAMEVLGKRGEKEATPHILRFLKSPFKYKRHAAMRALENMKDERAIKPMMEIIHKGLQHSDYIRALYVLASLRHEPIYGKIVELASLNPMNDTQDVRSRAISMLEIYGSKDSLPLLRKIAKSDPEQYIREKAQKAIDKIK